MGFSVCPEKKLKSLDRHNSCIKCKKYCFQTLWGMYDNFGAGDGQQAFYPGQMSKMIDAERISQYAKRNKGLKEMFDNFGTSDS